jgi:hypothetical protein
MMNYSAEIARLMERGNHDTRSLQQRAAREFAVLNGWRLRHWLTARTLIDGRAHNRPDDWQHGVGGFLEHQFDHRVSFREAARPYSAVAIVGQPYHETTTGEIERVAKAAADAGLELHMPPNLLASWHYPGRTCFFCFTRPGVKVRFLPEQQIQEQQQ